MPRLGIILPGKIGDIIICLPIAKYYADQGYEIHWPVYDHIISHFNKGHIDYVKFVPVPFYTSIEDSFKYCINAECDTLDLSFNNHGSWHNANTQQYRSQNTQSFDELRYTLAKVDFNQKWSLSINRMTHREDELFEKVHRGNRYVLLCDQSSDSKVRIELDTSNYTGDVIYIQPMTDCIFDWLKLIEQADAVLLVESCFSNLVDQMSIGVKKFLYHKHGYYGDVLVDGRYKGLPVLRGDWIVR